MLQTILYNLNYDHRTGSVANFTVFSKCYVLGAQALQWSGHKQLGHPHGQLPQPAG